MAVAKSKTVKTTSKKKTATGSHGKYKKWLEPEGLLLVQSWARDGLVDDQIAKNMGIHRDTLYTWKKKFPDFSDALKKGKEVVDIQVENALLKRALGYEYEEIEESESYNPETGQTVKTKKIIKHIVADTTAQIFWLKNRRPDKWRNNDRIETTEEDQLQQQANMHQATIEALKNRQVKDLFGEEFVDE